MRVLSLKDFSVLASLGTVYRFSRVLNRGTWRAYVPGYISVAGLNRRADRPTSCGANSQRHTRDIM